jgi:hypothetical protein
MASYFRMTYWHKQFCMCTSRFSSVAWLKNLRNRSLNLPINVSSLPKDNYCTEWYEIASPIIWCISPCIRIQTALLQWSLKINLMLWFSFYLGYKMYFAAASPPRTAYSECRLRPLLQSAMCDSTNALGLALWFTLPLNAAHEWPGSVHPPCRLSAPPSASGSLYVVSTIPAIKTTFKTRRKLD